MPEKLPIEITKPANLDEQYVLKDRVKRALKTLKNTGIIPQEIRDDIKSLLKLTKTDYSDKLTKSIADYEEQGFLALADVSGAIATLEAALKNFDEKVV